MPPHGTRPMQPHAAPWYTPALNDGKQTQTTRWISNCAPRDAWNRCTGNAGALHGKVQWIQVHRGTPPYPLTCKQPECLDSMRTCCRCMNSKEFIAHLYNLRYYIMFKMFVYYFSCLWMFVFAFSVRAASLITFLDFPGNIQIIYHPVSVNICVFGVPVHASWILFGDCKQIKILCAAIRCIILL